MLLRRLGALALLGLLLAAPATLAAEATAADREATYPAQITNVTQEPWQPRAGQDVQVTFALADDAPVPDQASLLYCRVEPSYTCGLPVLMEPTANGHYGATITWDDRFMRAETVHMGYNVTLHYRDPDDDSVRASERISAPTANHWLPETFPADSDGTYFFYRIAPGQVDEAAAPALLPSLVVLGALCALAGRGRIRR